MNRYDFLAATIVAAVGSPAPASPGKSPIAAEVSLRRDASALLAPFEVSISIDNTTHKSVPLEFPTADLFRIDVLQDNAPIWSSLTGHKPIPVNRHLDVPPGILKLASMTIDGTTDDHRSFAPGKYVVRVAMLGTSFGMVVDKEIDFQPPSTIDEMLRARPGTVVTISGEQVVIGNSPGLRDATGSVKLSRSLALRPSGTYLVRGFLDASGDDRVFDVGRFALSWETSPTPSPGP